MSRDRYQARGRFVLIVAAIAALPAGFRGQQLAAGEPTGRVFILGEEVLPSWEFSGIGSDTLRLNGRPFRPVRSNYKPPPLVVPEYELERSALWDSAFKATRDVESRLERHRAIAQFYEASDLVDSVSYSNPWDSTGFTIYWKGDPRGQPTPLWFVGERGGPLRPPPDSTTIASGHQAAIDMFWASMNSGDLLVLVRPGWQFGCGGEASEKALEVISLIRSGGVPDSALVAESGFRSWMMVYEFRKWMNPIPGK